MHGPKTMVGVISLTFIRGAACSAVSFESCCRVSDIFDVATVLLFRRVVDVLSVIVCRFPVIYIFLL